LARDYRTVAIVAISVEITKVLILRSDRNNKASYLQNSIILIKLQNPICSTNINFIFQNHWYDQDKKSRCGRRYRTDEKFQPFSISLNECNARTNLAICASGDKIFEPMKLGSKSMRFRGMQLKIPTNPKMNSKTDCSTAADTNFISVLPCS
jgi:hypothetical protein